MLFIFGRCICCCFMIGFCQISIIMEFLRNGFVSVFNLKKKPFSNCVHPLYLDSVCGILYTGAEVANMSWADPCLVKKLWLIHTIFECSVLLAVVFFWWRVLCDFSCFSLYSSFFLIDARICPDYIFLLIKRSLSKKNQKENYPSKWIWKKKFTDGTIKSVVKTCRKVKWNKIEVNFVGVMYIIWKLYDWNSSKICMQFQIWGKCEADHSQT